MKGVWQTPALIPLTVKKVKCKYFVFLKDMSIFVLIFHPMPPASLVVAAANERERQGTQVPTPEAKEAKKMDLFGRKL